ncbi:hypothetical protein D3C77_607200 [compost metagenome]
MRHYHIEAFLLAKTIEAPKHPQAQTLEPSVWESETNRSSPFFVPILRAWFATKEGVSHLVAIRQGTNNLVG